MNIRFLTSRRYSRRAPEPVTSIRFETESTEPSADPDSHIRPSSEKLNETYRKLKILRALFEAGQISEDEYEALKAGLLQRL